MARPPRAALAGLLVLAAAPPCSAANNPCFTTADNRRLAFRRDRLTGILLRRNAAQQGGACTTPVYTRIATALFGSPASPAIAG